MSISGLARIAITVLAGLWVAGGAVAAEIDLLAQSPETPVEVAIGDVLVVRLQGNASTGYAWERVDEDHGVLVQERATRPASKPERPPMIGAPTTAAWRFRAERAGAAELHLVYRQPWRKDKPPARELAWRVRVQPLP